MPLTKLQVLKGKPVIHTSKEEENMKKLFWAWVSVTLVMMLVFGGHSTAAPAANREQQLYEAAKKEGIVWFQTGVPTDRWAPFINHFQKKYPGIKLEIMNVRGTDIATRVITEASSGKLTIDVILNNIQQRPSCENTGRCVGNQQGRYEERFAR
jgi:ABC-type uncharacterized transport system YnjBCD substrate-binding protein